MSEAGPLSLGQLSVWHDIRDLPAPRWHEPNNAAAWPLPPGTTARQARTALRAIVTRHPSLRTRYDVQDAGAPRQLAPDEDFDDQLPAVAAEEAPPGSPADPDARAAGLAARPFDLRRDHGWRAGLLTRRGDPSHLLFAKHHIAADAWAQELLHREFRRALTDPGALGPPPPGPADLATDQHTPTGLRRQAAALGHWAHLLDRAPSVALPRTPGAEGGTVQATLRSAAARPAAHAVAERARVSVSSVVLAAYVHTVAARCDADTLLVQLMSANRFGGRWKDLVTSMNQWVPALIEQARRDDLVTLADAVHWSALAAVRHGMHDVTAVAALRASRPDAPEPTCAFNYVTLPGSSPLDAPVAPAPAGEPVLTWEEPFTTIGPRCYARVLESDRDLTVRLTAKDLGRDACADLLTGMHRTLLAAAAPH
ncbi:condensation domain-containing protein [Streptomyces sp. RS10V-4]|uniref:condensation domain-containing protein n=1 Tax=Streptomyces rhizoryzae TaxID=2932493 RepID=UPI002003303F|nr:condensation domain-containing protein [Streptomyces rhizoryzae]MCK7622630.1 condensation domain-containing protein [Streptomyces rhizoryzae]